MDHNGNHLHYPLSNHLSDWPFHGNNLISPSICLVPAQNDIASFQGDQLNPSPSSSSISMVDSNSEFCRNRNIQTTASTSNVSSSRIMDSIEKVLNSEWNLVNPMPKCGSFLQTGVGILPQDSAQFPADSTFTEQAAELSPFRSENPSKAVVIPFRTSAVSLSPFIESGANQMQEVPMGRTVNPAMRVPLDTSELQMSNFVINVPVEQNGSLLPSSDEAKVGVRPNNVSHAAEFSCFAEDEQSGNPSEQPSPNVLYGKKRKRSNKMGIQKDQAKGEGSPQLSAEGVEESMENKHKYEQSRSQVTKTISGKQSRDRSQNFSAPKGEFVHVRARRGQATNSHSLAERVRREKISERMKLLQDLVPGCHKVTGMALMLDEIINYVQSLQRQVEFLSMKLAAVNPQLPLNLEGLLSKDVFQSQGGAPHAFGFLPEASTLQPHLHPLYGNLIQELSQSIELLSDFPERNFSSHLTPTSGYKDPILQVKNEWKDELDNAVQMNFDINDNDSFTAQLLNGSLLSDSIKPEL